MGNSLKQGGCAFTVKGVFFPSLWACTWSEGIPCREPNGPHSQQGSSKDRNKGHLKEKKAESLPFYFTHSSSPSPKELKPFLLKSCPKGLGSRRTLLPFSTFSHSLNLGSPLQGMDLLTIRCITWGLEHALELAPNTFHLKDVLGTILEKSNRHQKQLE